MTERDQIQLRARMLRAEAQGCLDAVVDWEVNPNHDRRSANQAALRAAALVLYARAAGLVALLD